MYELKTIRCIMNLFLNRKEMLKLHYHILMKKDIHTSKSLFTVLLYDRQQIIVTFDAMSIIIFVSKLWRQLYVIMNTNQSSIFCECMNYDARKWNSRNCKKLILFIYYRITSIFKKKTVSRDFQVIFLIPIKWVWFTMSYIVGMKSMIFRKRITSYITESVAYIH